MFVIYVGSGYVDVAVIEGSDGPFVQRERFRRRSPVSFTSSSGARQSENARYGRERKQKRGVSRFVRNER